jgi:uncharacterized protein (DUF2147 family)
MKSLLNMVSRPLAFRPLPMAVCRIARGFEAGCMKRFVVCLLIIARAQAARAESSDGTWLIEHKAAVRLFSCDGAVCGSLVWLRKRNPQSVQSCNRTIIWRLKSIAPGRCGPGWFYDPENANTYHVTASQVSPDEITANVYLAISWLGETVSLLRIAPNSLNGWCE